jgi:hypothetical protein
MKYVIHREDGAFVARPGSLSSYTRNLMQARIFTASEVEREKCGNETAVPLSQVKPKGWD